MRKNELLLGSMTAAAKQWEHSGPETAAYLWRLPVHLRLLLQKPLCLITYSRASFKFWMSGLTWMSILLAGKQDEPYVWKSKCLEGQGLKRQRQTGSNFPHPSPAQKGNSLSALCRAILPRVHLPKLNKYRWAKCNAILYFFCGTTTKK